MVKADFVIGGIKYKYFGLWVAPPILFCRMDWIRGAWHIIVCRVDEYYSWLCVFCSQLVIPLGCLNSMAWYFDIHFILMPRVLRTCFVFWCCSLAAFDKNIGLLRTDELQKLYHFLWYNHHHHKPFLALSGNFYCSSIDASTQQGIYIHLHTSSCQISYIYMDIQLAAG